MKKSNGNGTVGARTRVQVSKETAQMAAAQTNGRKGEKGEAYHRDVQDLVTAGVPVGEAIGQVAERSGTSKANVSNAYYRVRRGATATATKGKRGATKERTAPAPASIDISMPQDLEPLLDALRKDRDSLRANTDKLIQWALGKQEEVKGEKERAYKDTQAKIREILAT